MPRRTPDNSPKFKSISRYNDPGHAHSLTVWCFRRQPFLERALFIVAACVVPLAVGCSEKRSASITDTRILTANEHSELQTILAGIGPNASLVLYEGLPHQTFEWNQMQKELATKKTIEIHEYPFYERPLAVSDADVATLRQLSLAPDSFVSYMGPKGCGGYHPDYCLEWTDGGATCELLICLGCREMELYAAGKKLLVDIRNSAFDQFEATLEKYRDQRPPIEY
jgi:hypothetical protein